MRTLIQTIGIVVACGTLAAIGRQHASHDESVDTYVLTPITEESFSMTVPADLCGPVTNNSCRDWTTHIETCYLPAHRVNVSVPQSQPALVALLERQLSAELGVWKPGTWPSDGQSIDISLEQYATFEHLWLARRLEIRHTIGHCWLDASGGAEEKVAKAATQPAAAFAVEMFGGTRDAKGYPVKTTF